MIAVFRGFLVLPRGYKGPISDYRCIFGSGERYSGLNAVRTCSDTSFYGNLWYDVILQRRDSPGNIVAKHGTHGAYELCVAV